MKKWLLYRCENERQKTTNYCFHPCILESRRQTRQFLSAGQKVLQTEMCGVMTLQSYSHEGTERIKKRNIFTMTYLLITVTYLLILCVKEQKQLISPPLSEDFHRLFLLGIQGRLTDNRVSSFHREAHSDWNLDYWFLILMQFFILIALPPDTELPCCKLNTIKLLISPLEYVDGITSISCWIMSSSNVFWIKSAW